MKNKTLTAGGAAVSVGVGFLLWAAAARFFLLMPWASILKFLGFQAFAVALPGLALAKLLRLRLSPLETLCVSYGLGVCALLAVYFIFAPFGLMTAIPWGVLAVSASAVAVLLRKRKQPLCEKADTGELRIALVFCTFAALATFVVLSCATLDPSLSGARSYYHDTLNGVALATSAARSFPMQILQMSGTEHRYHIFYFAYAAVMKLVTGLSSFEIVTKLTLITISPFAAAGIVAVARRVLKSTRSIVLSASLALLLPPYTFVVYLYSDVIGFTLGLAFAPLAVLLFLEASSQKKFNRYYVLSSLILLGCLGSKGPVAITLLFGICFCLLLRLLREKDWSVIPKGLVYAVPFFICYFLLYAGGAGDSMSFSLLYSAKRTGFAIAVRDILPPVVWEIVCFLSYLVLCDPVLFLYFVAVILYLCMFKKSRSTYMDFCFGGFLVAYILINLFKQMGSSEFYFLNIMLPFGCIALSMLLEAVFGRLRAASVRTRRIAKAAACAGLCALTVLSASGALPFYLGGEDGYKLSLYTAIRYSRFSGALVTSDEDIAALETAGTRRSSITPLEYEAMLWLRDNTPQDAVICDGRYLTNNKYFAGSAFSERAFYLEGWGYVTMEDSNDNTDEKIRRDSLLHLFYQNNDEKLVPLISAEGMDYIIITQYQNPGWTLSDKYCDLVFQNADVSIYKTHEYNA
ncbi:MAG: hypothetical protein VB092_09385 [Oscillospiraceae bacterium]|nr:hypothetical protein [Oscillospiraceae bacterium]